MERTILVTGGDKTYFLMGCMLVHSLRTFAPRLPIYFLDFGLERSQRRFLDSICTVIRRPKHINPASHHFAMKAAMGDFVRDISWTNLVWFDSDMIIIGAIVDRLKHLLGQMKETSSVIAASADSCGTISDFIADATSMKLSVAPFVEALGAAKIGVGETYLNVGLVVCRAAAFLDEWHKLTDSLTPHACFEQNAFNILARKRGPVTVLPAQQWNVHGVLLREAMAGAGGFILHATSSCADDLAFHDWMGFGSKRISGKVKLFRNPVLREFQELVLNDFMRTSEALLERLSILA